MHFIFIFLGHDCAFFGGVASLGPSYSSGKPHLHPEVVGTAERTVPTRHRVQCQHLARPGTPSSLLLSTCSYRSLESSAHLLSGPHLRLEGPAEPAVSGRRVGPGSWDVMAVCYVEYHTCAGHTRSLTRRQAIQGHLQSEPCRKGQAARAVADWRGSNLRTPGSGVRVSTAIQILGPENMARLQET